MKARSRSSSIPKKRSDGDNGQKPARRIAAHALRELKSAAVQTRPQRETA